MFSDGPWVTHCPFLNARTKMRWASPAFCSKVAHGTRGPPAASEPPTTSETPAFWLGSMPAAGSLLTCEPSDGQADHGARRSCRDERGRHAGKRGASEK